MNIVLLALHLINEDSYYWMLQLIFWGEGEARATFRSIFDHITHGTLRFDRFRSIFINFVTCRILENRIFLIFWNILEYLWSILESFRIFWNMITWDFIEFKENRPKSVETSAAMHFSWSWVQLAWSRCIWMSLSTIRIDYYYHYFICKFVWRHQNTTTTDADAPRGHAAAPAARFTCVPSRPSDTWASASPQHSHWTTITRPLSLALPSLKEVVVVVVVD